VGATQDTVFLRVKHEKPYLVTRYWVGDQRKEQWTPLADIDQKVLEAALHVKDTTAEQIVQVPCTNPDCKNTVPMSRTQLEEFFISSKKRYNMMVFPFCCDACRNAVLKKHGDGVGDGNSSRD